MSAGMSGTGQGTPVFVLRTCLLLPMHQVLNYYGAVLARQAGRQTLHSSVGAVLRDVDGKLAPTHKTHGPGVMTGLQYMVDACQNSDAEQVAVRGIRLCRRGQERSGAGRVW